MAKEIINEISNLFDLAEARNKLIREFNSIKLEEEEE